MPEVICAWRNGASQSPGQLESVALEGHFGRASGWWANAEGCRDSELVELLPDAIQQERAVRWKQYWTPDKVREVRQAVVSSARRGSGSPFASALSDGGRSAADSTRARTRPRARRRDWS